MPKKVGRPSKKELWRAAIGASVTKLTPEVVQKIKDAFAIGATVKQACYYAEVSERTYYSWTEKYPDLLRAFTAMREKLPLAAKTNIAGAIQSKDLGLSRWLVERTEPESYGETIKVDQKDTTPRQKDIESVGKEYEERLRVLLSGQDNKKTK